ncbi:MAG TPA: glycosyltransferase family 39 protein [Acidimicrobiales bacterium]|nr:glycosyltransferase family 39 protein [Acidimicrobiales bacterium]
MDGLQAPPGPGSSPVGDAAAVVPDPTVAPGRARADEGGAPGDVPPRWRPVGSAHPALTRLLLGAAVVAVVAGVVLRFVARSDLWLDEALTLDIARLPLGQIHGALRRDGAPPLYYYLLHFWVGAFGTSDTAVRALSGVLSCLTLPFVWLAGRRLGGRTVGLAALLIVATSPFAVRYATENRMYALVCLLTAAGVVALQQALRRPSAANVAAVAVVSGLLLYTHYWALYLVGVVGLWLAWQAWRGPAPRRRGAAWALGAVAVGCVSFVPWVPTFLFQAKHTGTPWAKPADFAAMVNAVTSFAGGATNQGRALALVYFALAGLGLFGAARGAVHIDLDLRTRPRGRAPALVLAGTLAVAVVGGYITRSAFQARYASVVFVPLVLLVALGLATFAERRIRVTVLALTMVFGLAGAVPNVWTSRTQAGEVAATLARLGRPGDVVAYCPDQLGPAVYHLLPQDRYRQITFPRGIGPAFVDWVDYAAASAKGQPGAFAAHLEALSGSRHQIWFVWAPGYQTFGIKCEQIQQSLLADPALGVQQLFTQKQVFEPWTGYESMELVRFFPRTG